MQKYIKIVGVIVVLLAVYGVYNLSSVDSTKGESIKIGVITPLTGPVAYWGEASQLGVELAKRDLIKEGINVQFITEDGQLDPKVALSAAQKLVNMDKVDALYSEFNPAAIAVTSYVKNMDIFHLYNAAPISPLKESVNVYKSYLDYETSCAKTAQVVKDRGITIVGLLKSNLEFGDLCLKGVKTVYGDDVYIEDYNPGTSDFRASLIKLKSKNVQALFNISYQPETLASFKQAKELGMNTVFVGLSETVTSDVVSDYSKILEGSIMFGLPDVSTEFKARISSEFPGKTVGSYQALAMSYIHLKQMAYAYDKCDKDLACVRKEMDNSKPESFIGFTGFQNHIAGFDILIQEWVSGKFVTIK